jgi:hypothetical protein
MKMGKKKCVAVNAEASFYEQVRDVFVAARQFVHKTANFAMVKAYWLVGKMIVEKQGGEAKAVYGDKLIVTLSSRLTEELGSGFTISNLKYMRKFYQSFPISHTLCDQLSWSHYRLLVSKAIKDYYTDTVSKSYFIDREGQKMSLPVKFLPSLKLLEKHRELLVG